MILFSGLFPDSEGMCFVWFGFLIKELDINCCHKWLQFLVSVYRQIRK